MTAAGKITTARLVDGTRVLVTTNRADAAAGETPANEWPIYTSRVERNAIAATVIGERVPADTARRYNVHTDQGTVYGVTGAQTWILAPEDDAPSADAVPAVPVPAGPTCSDPCGHRAGILGCGPDVLDCQGIPTSADQVAAGGTVVPDDATASECGTATIGRSFAYAVRAMRLDVSAVLVASSDPYMRHQVRDFTAYAFTAAGRPVVLVSYNSRGPLDRCEVRYVAVFVDGALLDGAGALNACRPSAELAADVAWRISRHVHDSAPADVPADASADVPAPADQVDAVPAADVAWRGGPVGWFDCTGCTARTFNPSGGATQTVDGTQTLCRTCTVDRMDAATDARPAGPYAVAIDGEPAAVMINRPMVPHAYVQSGEMETPGTERCTVQDCGRRPGAPIHRVDVDQVDQVDGPDDETSNAVDQVAAREAADECARVAALVAAGAPAVTSVPADLVGVQAAHLVGKDVAKIVRDALKVIFPGVRFSVRSDYDSLSVSWSDGPTRDAVDLVLSQFKGGGYADEASWYRGPVALVVPGDAPRVVDLSTRYMSTSRDLSPGLLESMRPHAARMAGHDVSDAEHFPGDLGGEFGVWYGCDNGRALLHWLAEKVPAGARTRNDGQVPCGAPGAAGRTCELGTGHPFPLVHRDGNGRPFIGAAPITGDQVAGSDTADKVRRLEAMAAQWDRTAATADAVGDRTRPSGDAYRGYAAECRAQVTAITGVPAADVAADAPADVPAPVDQVDAPAAGTESTSGPTVHRFDSTRQAYDASQCSDDIRDGDVLVVESERVAGFLMQAWPVAVTAERGELHGPNGDPSTFEGGRYATSVDTARRIAAGWDNGNGGGGAPTPAGPDDAPAGGDQVNELEAVRADVARHRAELDAPAVEPAAPGPDYAPEPYRARRIRAGDTVTAPALNDRGGNRMERVDLVALLVERLGCGCDRITADRPGAGDLSDTVKLLTGCGSLHPSSVLASAPPAAPVDQVDAPEDVDAVPAVCPVKGDPVTFTTKGGQRSGTVVRVKRDGTITVDVPDSDGGQWWDVHPSKIVTEAPAVDPAAGTELPEPGETDPAARWQFLGKMNSGAGSAEKRARWDRYVAAIRRVHGLADDVAHADLIAARDADPRPWVEKCAAYWQAYAELMTEDGVARALAAEPHPAPAVKAVTADMLAAAEAAGRKAYADFAPGMPGRAAALDSVVCELVEGLPVGGGAADVFAAFNRGYDAAADRRVADLELSLSISQQQATAGAVIAERNPAAQECADKYAAGAASVARTLAVVRADVDERAATVDQAEPAAGGDQVDQGEAADGPDVDVYTLPLEQYAPELDSDGPDADLTITHDHEDGTVLHGGRRGDGTLEIVRAHRFTWRRGSGVHIQASRDRFADLITIDKAAAALREAGHTVAVEIDDVWRPAAVREDHRAERASARAERLAERAMRHFGESEQRRATARSIGDRMPFGEPVKVGHHSERAHRRAFQRIEDNTRASIAAWDYAQHLANRAAGAESNEDAKHDPRAIMRRIERLEADARSWARELADQGTGPGRRRRASLEAEKIAEDIACQRAKLGDMAAAGAFVAWSAEHLSKGDWVNVGGRWCEVARINRKGVSVRARFEWDSRDRIQPVTWDEIHGRRRDGMQLDTPNGEAWSVEDARRVAMWRRLVRDLSVNHDRTDPEAVAQRRHTQYARRVVLGLGIMSTVQEIDAFGEPDDTAGKRARALAMMAAYERFAAGETFDQVAATTEPIGDTVPAWTMPAGDPVDVFPRDLVPGDIVAGVWDGFATMRTVSRCIVGPVTAPVTFQDRHESGDWATVTVDGVAHEVKTFRRLVAHLVGRR